MCPIPSTPTEKATFAKVQADHAHEARGATQAWNLEHNALWPGIVRDFHWRVLHAGGRRLLPLPDKTADQERWIRAVVKLVRLAVKNGRPEDLAAMWHAHIGVTAENGSEELFEDGVMHPDILQQCLEWSEMDRLYSEKGGLATPVGLRAFNDLHLTMALYETVVRDGLIFLVSLAKAADKKPTNFWSDLIDVRGQRATLPYLGQAVTRASNALGSMGKRVGITKRDKAALVALTSMLSRSGVWATSTHSNLGTLRDIVAHGKYSIDGIGTTHLDTYEHWVVNKFHLTTPGRIGYQTHPYKYRTITAPGARTMLKTACSLAVVLWAAYYEFNRNMYFGVHDQPSAPPLPVLQAAAANLLYVAPAAKEAEVKKELRRRTRLLKKYKVRTTLIRVDPAASPPGSAPS